MRLRLELMSPQAADKGPVAKQVLVEEDLAVVGLLGVDPGAAVKRSHPAGSLGESGAVRQKRVDSERAISAQPVKNLHKRESCTGETVFLGLKTTRLDPRIGSTSSSRSGSWTRMARSCSTRWPSLSDTKAGWMLNGSMASASRFLGL